VNTRCPVVIFKLLLNGVVTDATSLVGAADVFTASIVIVAVVCPPFVS